MHAQMLKWHPALPLHKRNTNKMIATTKFTVLCVAFWEVLPLRCRLLKEESYGWFDPAVRPVSCHTNLLAWQDVPPGTIMM